MEDKPLYNSRIIDTYIKLIKNKYSHVNITELLEYAGMKPYEVADQGHWFTQNQIDLFHEKIVWSTGNEHISHEAGQYSASTEALGLMRQYILGLVAPARAYGMVGMAARKLTKASVFESKKIASNKVEVTVKALKDVNEKAFQCDNRIGFLEAIAMGLNNKFPVVEHTECVFKGGECCRYIISWEKSISDLFKKIKNYSILFLFLLSIITMIIYPISQSSALLIASVVTILILTLLILIGDRLENAELKSGLNDLRDSSEKLIEQVENNYNNARVTNEIGQVISKQTNIEDILSKVCQVSDNRLDYDRGLILLANKDRTRLLIRTGFGYSEDKIELLNQTAFHLDKKESKGIFVVSFKKQQPFLVNNINEIQDNLSLRSLSFAKKIGTQSFICCPIVCDGESIGVFAVDNLKTKRPLVKSDMSLLMGISSVIGISIRNAELLEARTKQFRSLLQVMAASIDARDPLTAGHSENVTKYTKGICDELGVSNDYSEVVQVAASLHDYGKIGIPDALLKKPGRLTDQEYEVIKTHSIKTREILEQVNFEGMFSQVPEIAAAHHEKIDGSGYPLGLLGDEIPLGAQIIAVADFFEAITSKRHYRAPMPLDEAFQLLKKERGIHFEEKIVDAFTRYFIKIHDADKKLRLVS